MDKSKWIKVGVAAAVAGLGALGYTMPDWLRAVLAGLGVQ